MIHVVLDTNIYRSNPNRDNLHFKTLERLSKAKIIRLHIPYVVMREFQTQQRKIYSKYLTDIKSGLSGLSRGSLQLDVDILDKLQTLKSELNTESENILSNAENQIIQWADNIGANLYPLCIKQANAALEAYFQGNPPLTSIKIRNDIPDSFIIQSIHKLDIENDKTHVISGDKKIRNAFSDKCNIISHTSLSDFIESKLIQNELTDISNITAIKSAIQYKNDKSEILSFISSNIGEKIVSKTFSDQSIPDDNNEATIGGYYEAKEIDLDFSEIGYYGSGQFGIPFSSRIVVSAYYYIFKSDYSYMNFNGEHVLPVTDHNDHYFEVEDEFELIVHGLVSITVDRDNINLDDFSESVIDGGIEIAEITSIKLYQQIDPA